MAWASFPFLFDQLAARYGEVVAPKDQQVANAFNILAVLTLWLVSGRVRNYRYI
jgi:hypothetical protein